MTAEKNTRNKKSRPDQEGSIFFSEKRGKWVAEGGLSTATRIYNKRIYNLILNIETQPKK